MTPNPCPRTGEPRSSCPCSDCWRVPVRLTLPLPPPPNRWPKHRMALHRAKRKYQREAWLAAWQQSIPPHEPPARVRIRATLYVRNLRDEDNAAGSCKWPLDALKQHQTGKVWKQVGSERGYLVDDDPTRCILEKPVQVIDRKEPRLVLEIIAEPVSESEEAA